MATKRKPRRSWRSEARKSPALRATLARLGRRIRSLRTSIGRTQEQTAADALLDPKHFQAIERGTVNVTVATLAGIARALDVTIADLFVA